MKANPNAAHKDAMGMKITRDPVKVRAAIIEALQAKHSNALLQGSAWFKLERPSRLAMFFEDLEGATPQNMRNMVGDDLQTIRALALIGLYEVSKPEVPS